MIGILDYGMGNLRSVQKALEYLGERAVISGDKAVLDGSVHRESVIEVDVSDGIIQVRDKK